MGDDLNSSPARSAPLRIFLSYGHDENEELVKRIYDDLKGRGHDVWIDKSNIKAGDDWRRKITDGIIGSNRVLSFLSKYSTRDPGVCLDELAIAIGYKGANIQTVLVESETEVKPPPSIGHIQWLDMHDWKERQAADKAVWEEWYQCKLTEIVRVIESEQSRTFAGEIAALEECLKPISSDFRMAELLKKPLVGRTWLFDAVEQWRNGDDRSSRLFWIVGAPGVGKSTFAAHLCHFGRDKAIAAQFCQYNEPEHSSAKRIVPTLAFQIATRLPDYRKLLLTLPEIRDLGRKSSDELFSYLLTNPLNLCIGGGRERYLIIIDALDEAGGGGRNELVEMLARNAPRLPEWIGIVTTSRPESEVIAPLQGLKPVTLDTSTESNRADIREYLRRELSQHLEGHTDADRLIRQILDKSEGIFLYAESFCEYIHNGHLSLDRPNEFPQGLSGKYYLDFKRYFYDLDKYCNNVRPALGAILAACEPLSTDILQQLFNWQEEELHDFILVVGSLFPTTTEAGHEIIKAHHKSLADWLMNKTNAGVYFVSINKGHRGLADYGWKLLTERNTSFTGSIALHLPFHLCQAEDPIRLSFVLVGGGFDYFEQWAERGMALEGIHCLLFLDAYLSTQGSASSLRAIFATQLARLYNRMDNPEEADHWLHQALSTKDKDVQDSRVKSVAWHELGSASLSRGNYQEAQKAYRHALRLSRRSTPPLLHEIAANLIGLAVIAYLKDLRTDRTIHLASLALQNAETAHDIPHLAESCRILADVYKDDMQVEKAEVYLERGLCLARENQLTHATMSLLTARGWLLYQQAALGIIDPSKAENGFRDALRQAESAKDWRYIADAWSGLGQYGVLIRQENLVKESISNLSTSDPKTLPPHLQARRLLLVASSFFRSSSFAEAGHTYAELERFSHQNALWSREVDGVVGQGAVALHTGDSVGAEWHWRRAQSLLTNCPRFRQLVSACVIHAMRKDPGQCPL